MLKTRFLIISVICMFLYSIIQPVYALDSDPAITEDLISDYAIIVDTETNQILSEKNADERIFPASMTKMMTAIIAIESISDPDVQVTITEDMLAGLYEMNASIAGFMVGDRPTVRDLLYAAALPSGADACHALAYHTYGSIEAFVEKMNQKAAELGMTGTHFANTTGLDDDTHYSTVRDMEKLLQYCISNTLFAEVFSSASYVSTPLYSYPGGLPMTSTIWQTVSDYGYYVPGLVGGKTGFTYLAGHCLAYWAELNGMRIVAVTAHADTGMYEASHIEDASTVLMRLQEYEKKDLLRAGETVHTITVHHRKEDETISIYAPDTVILDLPHQEDTHITCTFPTEVDAQLHEQDLIGTLVIEQGGKTLYAVDIMCRIPREKSFWGRVLLWIKSKF